MYCVYDFHTRVYYAFKIGTMPGGMEVMYRACPNCLSFSMVLKRDGDYGTAMWYCEHCGECAEDDLPDW